MLEGAAGPPSSAKVPSDQVHVTYLASVTSGARVDVNRLDQLNQASEATNTLGGKVEWSPNNVVSVKPIQSGTSLVSGTFMSKQGAVADWEPRSAAPKRTQITWNQLNAFYQNNLPSANQDLSRFAALEFRVGVNWQDPVLNPVDLEETGGPTRHSGAGLHG